MSRIKRIDEQRATFANDSIRFDPQVNFTRFGGESDMKLV